MGVLSTADVPGPSHFTVPLLLCEHCDTVYQRLPLARGDVVRCVRCGAVIERHQSLSVFTLLALAMTALLVFVEANLWPIITLGLNGKKISTTLWGVILAMWHEDGQIISVLVAVTLFLFPLVNLLGMVWLLGFACKGRCAPGFRSWMVGLHYLHPWTMSEVFVLGVIVSVIKAHLYFEVSLEPGFFAYAVLIVLLALFASVDLRQLWELVPWQSNVESPE